MNKKFPILVVDLIFDYLKEFMKDFGSNVTLKNQKTLICIYFVANFH